MDGPLQCVTNKVFFERKSDRNKIIFYLVIGAYFSLKSTNFKTQIILGKATEKSEISHHQSKIHGQSQSNLIFPSFFL